VEHGVTGLLVAPGDANGLADSLERLLSDPAAAVAMGRAGTRRVEQRFSTREFVDGMVRVYAEAVDRIRPAVEHGAVFGDIDA